MEKEDVGLSGPRDEVEMMDLSMGEISMEMAMSTCRPMEYEQSREEQEGAAHD